MILPVKVLFFTLLFFIYCENNNSQIMSQKRVHFGDVSYHDSKSDEDQQNSDEHEVE